MRGGRRRVCRHRRHSVQAVRQLLARPRLQQVSAFLPDMFLITGCKASIRWGWSDLQIQESGRERKREGREV